MTFLAAVVTSPSYVAPLGAMIDAHARLGEVFATNPALGDYARMQTALRLFAAAGDRIELVGGRRIERSEEHTSELQSLMRISYDVFCLKKKNRKEKKNITTNNN